MIKKILLVFICLLILLGFMSAIPYKFTGSNRILKRAALALYDIDIKQGIFRFLPVSYLVAKKVSLEKQRISVQFNRLFITSPLKALFKKGFYTMNISDLDLVLAKRGENEPDYFWETFLYEDKIKVEYIKSEFSYKANSLIVEKFKARVDGIDIDGSGWIKDEELNFKLKFVGPSNQMNILFQGLIGMFPADNEQEIITMNLSIYGSKTKPYIHLKNEYFEFKSSLIVQ